MPNVMPGRILRKKKISTYRQVMQCCMFNCDLSCPFKHEYIEQKIENIEVEYKHGPDYISNVSVDVLKMLNSYIGKDDINLAHVSKLFNFLYTRRHFFIVACEDHKGLCVPDKKINNYRDIPDYKQIHICLDHTSRELIHRFHNEKRITNNIFGLCITSKNKYRRQKYYELVGMPIHCFENLEYLQYNNLALTHAECTITNTVTTLVITNCYQAIACNLIPDKLTNIEEVVIKNTILCTDIVFPSCLKRITLDVDYTRTTINNICKCQLEYLDITFTKFICNYLNVFPATLRLLKLRTKNTVAILDNIPLIIRLCTGYNVEGVIVESSLSLRCDIVYYKYQYKNIVIVLYV